MSPKTVFFIVNECKDKGGYLHRLDLGAQQAPEGVEAAGILGTTPYLTRGC